ncbi:L-threonylcarbamoyladenylate synthase, partial [Tremellales sp. Uapishka_1]
MSPTPVYPCLDVSSIVITPSAPPLHPLQCPAFTIPSSILPHLETASHHLHASRTVAFTTETVYGLGASSLDPEAVKKVYAIKNRPADNPLIMHVSSLDMLTRLLPPGDQYTLSPLYLALITAFWPGPLTLLFPSPRPPPPPAPQTNAIRMPRHPLALALIHHSNLPISAPSANSSGRPSPTRAQHVYNDLNGREGLGCILDGGDCGVGVESTVVNGLGWKQGGGGSIDVLRPGGLGVEDIARIVAEVDRRFDTAEPTIILVHGKPWVRETGDSSTTKTNGGATKQLHHSTSSLTHDLPPSTPGQKYRHYSPSIPVFLLLPSNTFPKPDRLAGISTTVSDVFQNLVSRLAGNKAGCRIGLLHFEDSPLYQALQALPRDVDLVPLSLGASATSAAQKLFDGILSLEGSSAGSKQPLVASRQALAPVDAILIEGCSDEGLGLAFMERVGKAVGGGGLTGELGRGQGTTENGRYWVEV